MNNELVLVTGGSGFLATHCILQLLEMNYPVRTTVRSPERELEVRATLKGSGSEPGEDLSFVVADLTSDAGWAEAVAGCSYVLHVASPFPSAAPKHEDELIIPAREGALRVLKAARDAGVKRVVLTSSFAAIGYSPKPEGETYTEEDWTDPNQTGISAYVKSKTVAERAAWDFITREGGELELTVVNPVGIFGPVLGPDYSTSITMVKRLLDGEMPGLPDLSFGIVDVRDAALLHLMAMESPAAKGERFLAVAGDSVSLYEMGHILRDRLREEASHVPTRVLPDWLVRLVSLVDSTLKPVLPELGKKKVISNEKARRVLGWTPRSNEEALVATAHSLIKLGLLEK